MINHYNYWKKKDKSLQFRTNYSIWDSNPHKRMSLDSLINYFILKSYYLKALNYGKLNLKYCSPAPKPHYCVKKKIPLSIDCCWHVIIMGPSYSLFFLYLFINKSRSKVCSLVLRDHNVCYVFFFIINKVIYYKIMLFRNKLNNDTCSASIIYLIYRCTIYKILFIHATIQNYSVAV